MCTLALYLLQMLYYHVLVLVIHPLTTMLYLVRNYIPCLVALTIASTSSSTFVETKHVEEIKRLKAQVTSLKNDLKRGHQGKVTLNKFLSVQKFPNDKSGLGFNSNIKNKSTFKFKHKDKNKNGQDQVKNPANIICFKCKEEGHHVI